MSDDRNRLRKTIEAYGEAIGHSSRGTERSREEARCAASDMMNQALAMFDELRERAEEVHDRLQTIADESFGPFPIEPAQELLTLIERGIYGLDHDFIHTRAKAEALEAENAALRERAEKAERARDDYRSELHSVGEALALANATTLDLLGMRSELREDQARLARYEATGPVLLTAPTGQGEIGKKLEALVAGAYREQHARCVAVVERLLADAMTPAPMHLDSGQRSYIQQERARDAVALRAALAALTGEAEK